MPRDTYKRYWLAMLAIVVVAFALRLSAVAGIASPTSALETAYEHADIARNLCAGKGFSWTFFTPPGQVAPTSQQAPWMPSVLAGAYSLFGVETPAAIRAVLLLQILASSITVLAVGQIALCSTGSQRIGLAAAAVASLYPPLIVAASHLQALVWNLAFLSLAIWGAIEIRSGRLRLGLGLFVPAAIGAWHSDPIIGVVSTALLAYVAVEAVIHTPSLIHPRIAALGLAAALVAVGLAPWTLRNYRVHGRWVLVKDSFPYVFWQGNTTDSRGTDKLAVEDYQAPSRDPRLGLGWSLDDAHRLRLHAASIDSTLPPEFVSHLMSLPTEIDRMDAFGSRILDELRRNPRQYFDKCALRLSQWLWFDETNPKSRLWPYRASYLTLVSLAGLGLWIRRAQWRQWRFFAVVALSLTAVHVLIITSARFRIPLEMLMIPPAVVPLVAAVNAVLRQPFDRLRPNLSISRRRAAA